MAEPPSALNGRVLDPSAVASWTEGRLAVQSWFGVAQPLADVTAAWVVTLARERGWTVLSADPRRLHVLDSHLPIDMV